MTRWTMRVPSFVRGGVRGRGGRYAGMARTCVPRTGRTGLRPGELRTEARGGGMEQCAGKTGVCRERSFHPGGAHGRMRGGPHRVRFGDEPVLQAGESPASRPVQQRSRADMGHVAECGDESGPSKSRAVLEMGCIAGTLGRPARALHRGHAVPGRVRDVARADRIVAAGRRVRRGEAAASRAAGGMGSRSGRLGKCGGRHELSEDVQVHALFFPWLRDSPRDSRPRRLQQ